MLPCAVLSRSTATRLLFAQALDADARVSLLQNLIKVPGQLLPAPVPVVGAQKKMGPPK